jgi:TRAP-type C4-dicarboxylate transport system substrate-binding protein
MKRTLLVVASLMAALAFPASSQTVIKFGSLAPIGSPWDTALKRIAADWSKVSAGKVALKIYSGGIAGDEPDMIRKVKLGQLEGVGLTGFGLTWLDPAVMSLQVPLLIRTEAELDYVLAKMMPVYEASLEKKGYKVLFWTKVGWAHFFSKKPVVTPDDLKKCKIFVWEGSSDEVRIWKEDGFNPVPLPGTDIMMALQSGMVDALTTSPLTAAAYQWFGLAPNMCGMKWAPFVGAMLVSTKTWNSLPADLRAKLLESSRRIGGSMQAEIAGADLKAMTVMKENGLKINPVPQAAVDQWAAMVEKGFVTKLAGKMFDKQVYDQIKVLLAEYRKAGK